MFSRLTSLFCGAAALLLIGTTLPAQRPTIDDFFRDFAADWVRHNPALATSTRYFTGEEQDRLERQLTPETLAWERERIQRARQGLAELRRFDRAKLTEVQRVSADLMEWQLQTLIDEGPGGEEVSRMQSGISAFPRQRNS